MTESTDAVDAVSRGTGGRFRESLGIIETILRNRCHYLLAIRDGVGLSAKTQAMLVSSIVFLAVYGAVLGSTHSVLQAISSAVKLPILFLATAALTSPTLYFFNILYGSNQGLRQNIALVFTAITVTSVILLAFAPISLFFLLTTSGYQFFKLLNVAFLAGGRHRRGVPGRGDARRRGPPAGGGSVGADVRPGGQPDGLDPAPLYRRAEHAL